jgi:hypothetical protein
MNKKIQKSWTNEEILLLKQMWDVDMKSDILKAFPERTYSSLKGKAKRLNVRKNKLISFHNKLSVLLEEKNEIYYWLGFLMADGHFSKLNDIKLSVSEKDFNHLKKFGNLINANISSCKEVTYDGYTSRSYSLAVRDVITVSKLKTKYSINSNKTENPCDISKFNTYEKFLSWFAGFFDGDGCVLKSKNGQINGLRIQIYHTWVNNLEFIREQIKLHLNVDSRAYIDSQGYARWVCFKNAKIVINAIQNLNLPIMERKLGITQ